MTLLQRLMGWASRRHVPLYRRTNGRVGGRAGGLDVLLLTTTGRRTGLERTTPLAFRRAGADLLVVGGAAGMDRHPGWYHNLVADSAVVVQVGATVEPHCARVLSGDERERVYEEFAASSSQYRRYQAMTVRQIPVVALTSA